MDVFYINIAICDDNAKERNLIKQLCSEYYSAFDTKVNYFEFSSGSSLLAFEERLDLLFLDIELGDMNGIEVMHTLEKKDNVWKIIFTTAYDYYMLDSFGIKTIGFLEKPVKANELTSYLSRIQNALFIACHPPIPVQNHDDIALSNILYIKSSGSYYDIYLFPSEERISCSGSVSSFIKSVNVPFLFRISKGTYINLLHVIGTADKALTLSNHTLIPLSSYYSKEFKNVYARFLLGRR